MIFEGVNVKGPRRESLKFGVVKDFLTADRVIKCVLRIKGAFKFYILYQTNRIKEVV